MTASPTIEKIARQTLHGEVTSRLRDLIVQGHFRPGERINEVRLGEELGVSRTPLREAIRTLGSEGLLELIPNRGAVVRTFSVEEVMDMTEAQNVIEEGCAVLACERATDEELDLFRERHLAMVEQYKTRKHLGYFQINQELHGMIVRFAGNETLIRLHADIQAKLKRIRFQGADRADVWARAVADHEKIAQALCARQADTLVGVLRAHKKLTMDRIKNSADGDLL